MSARPHHVEIRGLPDSASDTCLRLFVCSVLSLYSIEDAEVTHATDQLGGDPHVCVLMPSDSRGIAALNVLMGLRLHHLVPLVSLGPALAPPPGHFSAPIAMNGHLLPPLAPRVCRVIMPVAASDTLASDADSFATVGTLALHRGDSLGSW